MSDYRPQKCGKHFSHRYLQYDGTKCEILYRLDPYIETIILVKDSYKNTYS